MSSHATATLIVETSILSFVPYSNQSSLCSAIVTAGQSLINNNLSAAAYPSPGGCPYGPGPIMIGYHVPLGAMGTDDEIYPLTTLSTRLRILDTSYPPLQLACVDVQATPYFYGNSPVESTKRGTSLLVYDLVLWLPVAIFVALLVVNVAGRFFAAAGITRREHEANMASSLTTKLRRPSSAQRMKEILLETAIGRTIIRSKSLTRFVTPGVGDLLAFYQWVALIGMCSVRWQGFAYPILSRVGWSMLLFSTSSFEAGGGRASRARFAEALDYTRHDYGKPSGGAYRPSSQLRFLPSYEFQQIQQRRPLHHRHLSFLFQPRLHRQ